MSHVSLENAKKVINLMQQAAEIFMLPSFGKLTGNQIKNKSDNSIVTEVDLAVEAFLTKNLLEFFPGTIVVGEESVEADKENMKRIAQNNPVWVIDPLDGTEPFADGKKGWGILIAYMEQGQTEMGFVLDVLNGDHIIIIRNQGVFLNGEKMEKQEDIKPVMEQTGIIKFHSFAEDIRQELHNNRHYFKEILPDVSSSVEICFLLLTGKVDFIPCTRNQPWDIMPIVLMLDELGGKACKLVDDHPFTGERLTSNQEPSLFIRHAPQWQEIKEKLFANVPQTRMAQGIRKQH